MPTSWQTGRQQARLIGRATFAGFLEADLMPTGMQAPAMIWAAAFFVGPALFFPAQYLAKYPFLRRYYPEQVEAAFWSDRLLFLILSAGAIGMVAVVLWETLFPARRDAFVLTPLPVSPLVQVMGRLLGLGALFVAFALMLNAIPSFTFPVVTAPTFLGAFRMSVAHFVATSAADAFVFFSVTALEGTVILFVGRRVSSAMAAGVQSIAVLLLLLCLLFMNPLRAFVAGALSDGFPHAAALDWFPMAWFLGLYDWIAGSDNPLIPQLAARAALAAVIPFALTAAIHLAGYNRLLARAVETRERSTRSPITAACAAVVRTVAMRRGEDQAIAGFMMRTLARSARHRMLLSVAIGAAFAIITTAILPELLRRGAASLAIPSVATLSAPLVVAVTLAVGLRFLMTIPAEMPPRWVFQAMPLTARSVDRAVHRSMALFVVVPVAVVAAASALALWGVGVAWQHTIFCGSLALVLCEGLLARFEGVPFTRPYVPGGARIHTLWPLYLTLFFAYTYGSARLEQELLASGGIVTATAWFTGLSVLLWGRRAWKRRSNLDVSFEVDLPDVMFAGFNLSEGLAAEAVHRSHTSVHTTSTTAHPDSASSA